MIQPINKFNSTTTFKNSPTKYDNLYKQLAQTGDDYKKYYARYKSKEFTPTSKQLDVVKEYFKSFKGVFGRRFLQLILSGGITEALIIGLVVINTNRVNEQRLNNKKNYDIYVKNFENKIKEENAEQSKINYQENNIREKANNQKEADALIRAEALKRLKGNYSRHSNLPMNTFRDLQKHFGLKPLETNTPTEEQAKTAFKDIKDMLVLQIAEKISENKPKKEVEELYNISYGISNNIKSSNYSEDYKEAIILKEALELATDAKIPSPSYKEVNALINFTKEFKLYTEKMLIQALFNSGYELCALNDLPKEIFNAEVRQNHFTKIV